ncbi:GH32 C-terminal domain-containing protein [Mesorhizobium sp. BR1-1-16]|uniref:glycoside hydrolase family 32 protein n=1 Tax=Mesorhizobium sp. BR1-1-16 TaxID=2876653 RepID=UPI001CC8F629|nr:glycoside hydrolase family 32 protein [Mesorhizobium sp. BR1-1-16]MBZ9939236.1 GH32 C-terminal domain-containing protein [Mesorhizobium sp. BR1-1-16]
MKSTITLSASYQLEFWAQGPGSIRIVRDDDLLWQVPAFSSHPDFFRYHHREVGVVTLEWDRSEAILWAYGYDPQTVTETGITIFEFGAEGLALRTGPEIDARLRSDPARPVMHFSPIRQWMNDPNGLCKIGETWHIFYQFHPAGTDWGPMHWGHAVSTDLFNWTHLPVFLHPEQNLWRLGATGGAFSGNAFEDRDGSRMFFYTERLPAYDLFKGYREVQKLARPGRGLLHATSVETVIAVRPEADGVDHDFRDPKVWWDEGARAYRMALGSALFGDPAVLLYGSDNLIDWSYLGPIYRAPAHYRENGARAVECPDFFPLGDKWVMLMAFVGYTEPATGRHNLSFALVGEFKDDAFVPDTGELQVLDFGTDFYAMQTFRAGERQVAFAWLFNWEDRKPAGSPYSGEMSLPREISLDSTGRLLMRPSAELQNAWRADPLVREADGSFKLNDAPFELFITGNLEGSRVAATERDALAFEIVVTGGRVSVRLPQDDGRIRYEAECALAADLRIIYDRGIIEIFADNGAICGTRRSYTNIAPDKIEIMSSARFILSERQAV